jgi:hypothetical protein
MATQAEKKRRPRQPGASAFIGLNNRPDPERVRVLLAERDRMLAADTRTECERMLGDPPPNRSALAHRSKA